MADPQNTTDSSDAKNLVIHADDAAFVKSETATTATTPAMLATFSDGIKSHLDQAMAEMRESLLNVMQQESVRRTALEQRFHAQLLLQNEYMVAMELKLLRLEAKVERREAAIRQQQTQQQRSSSNNNHLSFLNTNNFHPQPSSSSNSRPPPTFTTITESPVEITRPSSMRSTSARAEGAPPEMAVNISSGNSLASGVTAGSFLGDDGDEVGATGDGGDDDDDDDDDDVASENRSDSGNPMLGEAEEGEAMLGDNERLLLIASQQSTPTLGPRPRVSIGEENGTLESILMTPMLGETNFQALSVRATRGQQDTDGNSSLATSVTNSTFTSTVVTATARGDVNVRRLLPEEQEQSELEDLSTPSRRGRSSPAEAMISREEPRSRSQSPLTVNTHASETLSMASASTVGTSIRSSVAVAPRVFGRNSRTLSAMTAGSNVSTDTRPLADRVVSFTPELITHLPAAAYSVEATDSITMPDELDNFSEIADTFANSSRVWREEYEARLDALHKRWSNE